MAKDWASNEMREVSNKQAIVKQIIFFYFPLEGINKEGNLGKGEERYAEGKNDISRG